MNMTQTNHESLTAEQKEELHNCAQVRIGGNLEYFPDYEKMTYVINWQEMEPEHLEKIEIEKAKELFGECTMMQVAMMKRDFLRAAIMQRTCGGDEPNFLLATFSKDFKSFIKPINSKQEQYLLDLCNELKKIEKDEEDILDTFTGKFASLIEPHFDKDNCEFLVQRLFDIIKSRAFKTFTAMTGMTRGWFGGIDRLLVRSMEKGMILEDQPKSFQEAISLGVGICLQIRPDKIIILPKPNTDTVVEATKLAGIKL